MRDTNFNADLDRDARKDNFEKLCGQNGELVELRRKQIMMGAVYILMNNCKKYMYCKGCPLLDRNSGGCFIEDRRPFEWKLPEV